MEEYLPATTDLKVEKVGFGKAVFRIHQQPKRISERKKYSESISPTVLLYNWKDLAKVILNTKNPQPF